MSSFPATAAPVVSSERTVWRTERTTADNTFRLVRRSDPERFLLGLIHGREETVVLRIPRRLLPVPAARVSQLLGVPIPATDGAGRLLAQFLTTLAGLERDERDTLGHIAVDLAGAVLAHHLDENPPVPGSPTHVLYLRVMSFVDRNLHVPDLGLAAIASAHGISVRYLHRIFQLHHGAGVHAYLRSRRLDRCRRDLANPCLDHLTIASIAARWGFTRPADFSRAFRRETGVPPSRYRVTSRVPTPWG